MLVNGNSYLATEIEKRKMEIIITLTQTTCKPDPATTTGLAS